MTKYDSQWLSQTRISENPGGKKSQDFLTRWEKIQNLSPQWKYKIYSEPVKKEKKILGVKWPMENYMRHPVKFFFHIFEPAKVSFF